MIFNILLFVLIGISVYYLIKKNEEYYNEFIKYYEKNKKVKLKERLNYIHRINILIDRCALNRSIVINPLSIILCGFMSVIIAYIFVFNFFKIILLSFIISIPAFYFPFAILKMIANRFLIEISSGIKFEKAIENFKEKINIKQIKSFLTNVQHCYLYGGNFSELIDKSYKMISELQKEKEKRIQETKSARIVLFILIFMDLFVYISFVKSNPENYLIMRKSIVGMMILYWNFISMWILLWISSKVKKLDY